MTEIRGYTLDQVNLFVEAIDRQFKSDRIRSVLDGRSAMFAQKDFKAYLKDLQR